MSLLLGAFEAEDNCELEIYRYLADEYRRECGSRPFANHCDIARDIGARVFNVPTAILRSPTRGKPFICETRQKLMAFARVVSEQQRRPNSWKRIGQAFARDHSTVIHSAHKYRDVIVRALRA